MAFPTETSLLHLLHRAVQVGTDRFARGLGETGLTARQLVILKAIEANVGASQTAIVEITGVDRSTMADIARRLMKRHLIHESGPRKMRGLTRSRLPMRVAALVQQAEPVLRAVEKDMLAAIPVKERAAWLETLRAVAVVV